VAHALTATPGNIKVRLARHPVLTVELASITQKQGRQPVMIVLIVGPGNIPRQQLLLQSPRVLIVLSDVLELQLVSHPLLHVLLAQPVRTKTKLGKRNANLVLRTNTKQAQRKQVVTPVANVRKEEGTLALKQPVSNVQIVWLVHI
jgi:hypothetical protein